MFRRLFGNKQSSKQNKAIKKRLSPSARTPEGMAQTHPMYQYALQEYAQTVAPSTSNDDGRTVYSTNNDNDNNEEDRASSHRSLNMAQPSHDDSTAASTANLHLRSRSPVNNSDAAQQQWEANHPLSPKPEYVFSDLPVHHEQQQQQQQQQKQPHIPALYPLQEPNMPDATYEEQYGDAYIGGPIKYVYPSGYQSMRPRGGPWKLSIVICLLFTWLSIFIIGHCATEGDQQADMDDDTRVIETRWCGSRLLYLMWVISMLITGLATAYCSVIGYIKVRDFAVANVRSQPPGMLGKSDYYVQIRNNHPAQPTHTPQNHAQDNYNYNHYYAQEENYQKTIYQADGTPQFWGGHIYRPTQAAVAITSR
jgi:hypothetical protein